MGFGMKEKSIIIISFRIFLNFFYELTSYMLSPIFYINMNNTDVKSLLVIAERKLISPYKTNQLLFIKSTIAYCLVILQILLEFCTL